MIELQRFRKKYNIKQSEICRVLGVKQPYISAIERGMRPLNEEQFRLLYNQYGDIILPYKITERPIFESEKTDKIDMSREVFNKISQLIDTVCSQQATMASQQRTIEHYALSDRRGNAREADNAGSADVG